MACGIYMIQNKINNKIYIGQAVNIANRFYDHKKGYGINHNSAIDLAIQKYGEENFTFIILKECAKKDLNYWEAYFADFYDCYAPKGYNINKCGEAFHNSSADKEISSYDLKSGLLVATYPSTHEAERQGGYCRQSIAAVANGKEKCKTAYNLYWKWGHEPQIEIIKPKAGFNGGKFVYQYDLTTGKYINTFNSLAQAERYLNKPGANKNSSAVCLGKRKSAYGYIWSYKLYNNIKSGE
jgi:hypothetical protein